jgi:hypothetical protein
MRGFRGDVGSHDPSPGNAKDPLRRDLSLHKPGDSQIPVRPQAAVDDHSVFYFEVGCHEPLFSRIEHKKQTEIKYLQDFHPSSTMAPRRFFVEEQPPGELSTATFVVASPHS